MRSTAIDWRLFFALVATFIAFTIIGTLSHECGHALVAKAYGYDPSVHYGYTILGKVPDQDSLNSLGSRAEQTGNYSAVYKLQRKISNQDTIITWGGPMQTMLTGTIGLILLLFYWKHFRKQKRLNLRQWLILFISLFWLRQLANFVVGVAHRLIKGYVSTRSDETQLELGYKLPAELISITTAAIALVVFAIVFFAIPRRQQFIFLCAGAIGGVAGYMLWLEWLGPIIMP